MGEFHSLTLSSNRKLAYAEYGSAADDAIPLLYFHGWPSSRIQGALLDRVGKEQNWRVIAPDRPGIGLSDRQPGRSLMDWPAVVEELVDALEIGQFYVCGVSGDGPYALVTAHGLKSRVLAATVICGAPPLAQIGVGSLMWPYRVAMAIRRRAPVMLDQAFRIAATVSRQPRSGILMRTLIASLGKEDQRALAMDDHYDIMTRSFQEAVQAHGVQALREDGDLYTAEWGFDPVEISVPLSIHHGGQDHNIPLSTVEAYANRMKGSVLHVYADDGHYALPLLRSREIILEMLRGSTTADCDG